jgi:hypothetical protein
VPGLNDRAFLFLPEGSDAPRSEKAPRNHDAEATGHDRYQAGGATTLEHFPAKWRPLCVVKMRQNKVLELLSDSMETESALGRRFLPRLRYVGIAADWLLVHPVSTDRIEIIEA